MSQQAETFGLYGSTATPEAQREALRTGRVPVAVYGLGKMGLPLASVYAEVTGNVTGVDLDAARVERIEAGDCPVIGEPDLPERMAEVVEAGALAATTDGTRAAREARIHVVIVPTLVHENGVPDLGAVRSVVETIASGLAPGDMVVIESTVPPRTCVDFVQPLLARESGLSEDEFGLAFCPERTKSGQALADITGTHPKVVGGVDAESTRVASLIYREITSNELVELSDATAAECVKVFEGVYRDVNIALANELGRFADELGVDVVEAIEAANTQPVCDIHTPGIGVGGHCIPYYPYFLLSPFETDAPLMRTARGINDAMPLFAVNKLEEGLDRKGIPLHDARVALLGLTYRPGVEEIRKSPALPVAQRLAGAGATVYGVDPILHDTSAFPLTPAALDDLATLDLDAVVFVTAHREFAAIDWAALDPLVVVDGRDALDLDGTDHDVYTIGRGH
ncbi:nucleotide sugar dehydrogenase [Halorarius litoreus]|uniref:nucleotide sugar dehydrogenase n=1 Tax=Halorarius litoreus TaxID=2962676 RepID=UPI0020CE4EA4|nr:nucleotide sugar dehydrogenase [Halorarius litoreus]